MFRVLIDVPVLCEARKCLGVFKWFHELILVCSSVAYVHPVLEDLLV